MIHITSIKETALDPKTMLALIDILQDEAPGKTLTAVGIINKLMMRAENAVQA